MGNKKIRNKKINTSAVTPKPAAPILISTQVWLPQTWIYRVIGNLFLLSIIFSLAFVIFTIKSNLIGKQLGTISNQFYTFSSHLGFNVNDIIIRGRKHTKKQDIMNILNISRNHNIMQLDLNDIKEKIESLPWIRKANIQRQYFPNILQIDLQERVVKSIWQFENNFYHSL